MRDQRLRVFKEIARDFSTLGLEDNGKDVLNIVGTASEATLLIKDKKLISKIDDFLDNLCELREGEEITKTQDQIKEIERLQSVAKQLIEKLRTALKDETLM